MPSIDVLSAKQHEFTAEEFIKLDIPERTQLLGGLIFDVAPCNEPHRHALRVLNELLVGGLAGSRLRVQVRDAVAVPDWQGRDAPEIDVAIIERKRYDLGPTSAEAAAFIEVSDTTYADDRRYKIPLYVRAGVTSWIVNIPARRVERYASPADLESAAGSIYDEDSIVEICGIAMTVRDLF